MPFLRFSRDKRGYEHFYLVQPTSARRGRDRQRILYWFRSPPNVKVGREPFAQHVRSALEAQYPGVRFDWDTLVATPIPPPEQQEHWRERRRAERARRTAEAEPAVQEADAGPLEEPAPTANASAPDEAASERGSGSGSAEPAALSVSPASGGAVEPRTNPEALRRRGRRRRGRRDHRPGRETTLPADKPEGK